MIEKFGKESTSLLPLKQNFIDDNDSLLKKGQQIDALYRKQPKRKKCKICNNPVGPITFSKQGIGYGECKLCGHLNGLYEDTNEFYSEIFSNDGGKEYGKTYDFRDLNAFNKRVKSIYIPKAEFLIETLTELGEEPFSLKYMDLGAGAGYFLSALKKIKLSNCSGYDVSQVQVELGNNMLGEKILHSHPLDEMSNIARNGDADVICMMGVLEHLSNPREILKSIQENSKARYFYLSMPLYSASVYFEMIFPDIMQRHLDAGHTHLWTIESID